MLLKGPGAPAMQNNLGRADASVRLQGLLVRGRMGEKARPLRQVWRRGIRACNKPVLFNKREHLRKAGSQVEAATPSTGRHMVSLAGTRSHEHT